METNPYESPQGAGQVENRQMQRRSSFSLRRLLYVVSAGALGTVCGSVIGGQILQWSPPFSSTAYYAYVFLLFAGAFAGVAIGLRLYRRHLDRSGLVQSPGSDLPPDQSR